MSTAKLAPVFLAMKTGWEKMDWRACADLFHPDGVLHSVMLAPCVGRESIYQRIAASEKPNKSVRLHIKRMIENDTTLWVERLDEIVMDGRSTSVPTVGILEFEGQRIIRWSEYYDRASLLKALELDIEHHK